MTTLDALAYTKILNRLLVHRSDSFLEYDDRVYRAWIIAQISRLIDNCHDSGYLSNDLQDNHLANCKLYCD